MSIHLRTEWLLIALADVTGIAGSIAEPHRFEDDAPPLARSRFAVSVSQARLCDR